MHGGICRIFFVLVDELDAIQTQFNILKDTALDA
jgi:hypothetical protein